MWCKSLLCFIIPSSSWRIFKKNIKIRNQKIQDTYILKHHLLLEYKKYININCFTLVQQHVLFWDKVGLGNSLNFKFFTRSLEFLLITISYTLNKLTWYFSRTVLHFHEHPFVLWFLHCSKPENLGWRYVQVRMFNITEMININDVISVSVNEKQL